MCVLVKSSHQGYAVFASAGATPRRGQGTGLPAFFEDAAKVPTDPILMKAAL